MEEQNNYRLNYVDYLKCFAIYLVVLGHCSIDSKLMHIIYSFHLPLFFFLSGYVFNVDKYEYNFKGFIKSRFKNLLIPYFKYCIYIVLFLTFISELKGEQLQYNFLDIINALVIGLRFGKCGVTLWFILSLFTIQLIILILCKIFKSDKLIIFILLLTSFITIFITNGTKFRLPVYFDLSLAFLLFFEIGILSRKFNIMKLLINKVRFIYFGLLMYICMLLLNLTYFTKGINPFFNMYGNPFLFYGTAMSAIAILLILAYKIDERIEKDNYFLEIGKNTNIIYCLHQFIALPICINCFSFVLNYIPNTLFFVFISFLCIFIIMKYKSLKTFLSRKKYIIGKIM